MKKKVGVLRELTKQQLQHQLHIMQEIRNAINAIIVAIILIILKPLVTQRKALRNTANL